MEEKNIKKENTNLKTKKTNNDNKLQNHKEETFDNQTQKDKKININSKEQNINNKLQKDKEQSINNKAQKDKEQNINNKVPKDKEQNINNKAQKDKEQNTDSKTKKTEKNAKNETENKVIETKLGKVEYKENTNNKNKIKEKPKTKVKKEKKSKKWLLVVVLLIVLIVLAVMVLYTSITPRSSVNNLLTNLKNGNKFMAELNIDYDNLMTVLDSTIVANSGNSMSNLEKECFNKLSWEITGESVENTKATVTATITTKNFRQVLLNWIEKISEVLETQEDISSEQNLQLLEESLVKDNVDTRTTDITINLERKGLTWKINLDEDFIDAMFPGMTQVLDVMEQLSNDLQEENTEQAQ